MIVAAPKLPCNRNTCSGQRAYARWGQPVLLHLELRYAIQQYMFLFPILLSTKIPILYILIKSYYSISHYYRHLFPSFPVENENYPFSSFLNPFSIMNLQDLPNPLSTSLVSKQQQESFHTSLAWRITQQSCCKNLTDPEKCMLGLAHKHAQTVKLDVR